MEVVEVVVLRRMSLPAIRPATAPERRAGEATAYRPASRDAFMGAGPALGEPRYRYRLTLATASSGGSGCSR